MLIMPSTARDFSGMAASIASDFFRGGESLEDGIVKTAKENALTPEEVRRLVEKTNTTASIQLLRSEGDKKRVFDVADFARVIRRTHPTAEQAEEENPQEEREAYHGLPSTREDDEDSAAEEDTDESADKHHAEKKAEEAGTSLPGGKAALPSHIFRAKFLLEGAMREKYAAERKIRDNLDAIISEFSILRAPDFQKFAADAMALYGDAAVSVLTPMAEYLGEKMPMEKTEGIVDDRGRLMRLLGDSCEGLCKIAGQAAEIEELKRAIDYYTAVAFGAKA